MSRQQVGSRDSVRNAIPVNVPKSVRKEASDTVVATPESNRGAKIVNSRLNVGCGRPGGRGNHGSRVGIAETRYVQRAANGDREETTQVRGDCVGWVGWLVHARSAER